MKKLKEAINEAQLNELDDSAIKFIFPDSMQKDMAVAMDRTDDETSKLMLQVYTKLKDRFRLQPGEVEAINRMKLIAMNAKKWDSSLIRNNVFKAANRLGIKLPSSSF